MSISNCARFRRRRCNDTVDVPRLCAALTPFARLKDNSFDWEIAQYSKERRSQGPCRDGLLHYKALLMTILDFAPGGLPNMSQLRETWLWLDRRFGIMHEDERKTRVDPGAWAEAAVDKVRVMLKHAVDLKTSGTGFVNPDLQEVLAKIQDPGTSPAPASSASGTSPLVSAAAAAGPPPTPVARQLHAHPSDASVVLCGFQCMCSRCKEPVVVEVLDSQASSTSAVAEANEETAPCGRGIVKALCKKPAAASHKRPAQALGDDALRVSLVRRYSGSPEAYIMVQGKSWGGLRLTKHPRALEFVEALQEKVVSREIGSKEAAKTFLAACVAHGAVPAP